MLSGAEKNFATYTHGVQDTLRMPYDKHSLMHYGNKEFTKNYADTLQDIENPDESLGGRTLSKIDTKQILMLYKCKKPRYKVRQGKSILLTFLMLPDDSEIMQAL